MLWAQQTFGQTKASLSQTGQVVISWGRAVQKHLFRETNIRLLLPATRDVPGKRIFSRDHQLIIDFALDFIEGRHQPHRNHLVNRLPSLRTGHPPL